MLNVDTSNPSNGGESVLIKQMVGFIIETPLAESDVSSDILQFLDHVGEIFLLHFVKLFVIFGRFDFKTMLGLWLWGLKGAGQDGNTCISDALLHLRVREILINDDSLNESCVLDASSSLSDHLDQVEVDIFSLEVSNGKHGIDSNLCELILALGNNFRSKGSNSALLELSVIVLKDIDFFRNFIYFLHGNIAPDFKTLRNLKGVNSLL